MFYRIRQEKFPETSPFDARNHENTAPGPALRTGVAAGNMLKAGMGDSNSQDGVSEQDLQFLRRAIALAAEARADGRHPFGALVVNERGEIVVRARNNAVRPKGDPTQHAEMLACAEAARRLPEAELANCTLYTSTEPCAMCAGAIYWTGIGRVVFALAESGLLRYTGTHEENPTLSLPCREVFARGQKKIRVEGPMLEEEAGKVHEGFWSA
jgi:tRNA(Arg) A34 adenosine deaminase TadA